jgi:nucleotide-binding universal stress UspA family protein
MPETDELGPDARGLVVGYDGSEAAGAAVDWAAAEAARRGVPLTVAAAAGVVGLDGAVHAVAPSGTTPGPGAEVARRGADRARRAAPGVDVRAATHREGAAGMLVELSSWAELLVVGSRGHGEAVSALLGSVARAVCAHARCPVVVVRDADHPLPGPRHAVLVGVDGSAESDFALRYAAGWAAAVAATLTVLTVSPGGLVDSAELAAKTNAKAADAAQEAYPDLEVRRHVLVGTPADMIAELGRGHALVVVGSRGGGGFRGLLLGSVSRAVVHRASCPVVIVRRVDDVTRRVPPAQL